MRPISIRSGRESAERPFLGWPDVPTWRTYGWVALAGALWFVLVYGGADYVTARRSLRIPIHFDAELRIPFVVSAVWAYMSIYPLFLMAPFVLRSSRQVIALGACLAAVNSAGAIGFLLIPAELTFPSRGAAIEPGVTAQMYAFADWLNLRYNLLPSLHVGLSVACIATYAPRAGRAGRLWLWAWALAVAISTVLTHFHHVLDALSGFVLGLAAVRVVYEPLAQATRPDRLSPTSAGGTGDRRVVAEASSTPTLRDTQSAYPDRGGWEARRRPPDRCPSG
jgi:hypothetical protein